MSFNCLIVDDEPLARKLLASHILKMEGLKPVGECEDAIQAGKFLREHKVDLVFLDIQMPEITGLQFLRTLKNPPSIILTTAHRDFAIEAFDLDAVDYLLKPISLERFFQAVNKFYDRKTGVGRNPATNDESDFIYLKSNRKTHKVRLADIQYIESLDNYVKIHLSTSQMVTSEGINSLEKYFPSQDFVRIHRSFIINKKFLSTISGEGVEVAGKQIPFGRAFKRAALAALSLKDEND